MKYLLLIYGTEGDAMDASTEEFDDVLKAYRSFTDEIDARGIHLGSHALQPTTTATTVRVQDDETLVTDGPFAETKEALNGYYLVDCTDLDEAIEIAAKIPGARHGSIEVRPIWEIES